MLYLESHSEERPILACILHNSYIYKKGSNSLALHPSIQIPIVNSQTIQQTINWNYINLTVP